MRNRSHNHNRFIKKLYFDDRELNQRDYKKSRQYFIFEGCAAMGIFSITSGAFLAGLAEHLGASDEFNGIIGAIPALAGVVQIIASMVFEKLERRKFLISILCFVFRILLGIMFMIPVLIKNTELRLVALASIYSLAYVLSSFISPPASNWIVELTPINMRGKYFALKDSFSLAFVTIITIIMGRILDVFRGENAINTGYVIIAVVVILLSVINFVFLSIISEPKTHQMKNEIKMKDIILKPLQNSDFRKIIILFIIWNVALQVAGPFFSVYMVTKLKMTYTYIMIMGVITSVVRVVIVVYWGRFADSRSWVSAAKYSIASLALCHVIWTLVDRNSMYILVPLLHILGGIAWAGINLSLFNIQFVFAPKEGRTMYLGLNAAIGGVLGFSSTILGSVLLNFFRSTKINFLIFSIGNMQILFLLSGVLLLMCSFYIHVSIREIKSDY